MKSGNEMRLAIGKDHESRTNMRITSVFSPWPRLLIALMLALGSGNAAGSTSARAQDEDPDGFQFLVDVISPLAKPLCIGETRDISVRILERGTIRANEPMENASITLGPGTSVTGEVADTAIAQITSARTLLINSPSPTRARPGVVSFTVKALKAGKTAIDFSGVVKFQNLTIQAQPFKGVPIEVLNCKFKVTAVHQAVVAGGGHFNVVAMMDEAEIRADPQGHFTGTAPVRWAGASATIPPCFVTIKVAGSTQAELSADMNESGQLALKLNLQAPETSTTATCAGVTRTETTPLSAEPLELDVPNAGGVVTLAQGLIFMTAHMPGSAMIIVIPEEDQATGYRDSLILLNLFPGAPPATRFWSGEIQ
jgi:hypothetical protein